MTPAPVPERGGADGGDIGKLAARAPAVEAPVAGEGLVGGLAPPRVEAILAAAGRGVLPLGLGRQAPAVPGAEREGLEPADAVEPERLVGARGVRPGLVCPR